MSNTKQLTALSEVLFFPGELRTFKAIAWDGKINSECTTTAFRKAESNPDLNQFVEIHASEMQSARGSKPSRLWIEKGVEVWGWM
jgi:hypothetical protein